MEKVSTEAEHFVHILHYWRRPFVDHVICMESKIADYKTPTKMHPQLIHLSV